MDTGEVMGGLRPLRVTADSSGVPYGVGVVVGTVGSRSPFLSLSKEARQLLWIQSEDLFSNSTDNTDHGVGQDPPRACLSRDLRVP